MRQIPQSSLVKFITSIVLVTASIPAAISASASSPVTPAPQAPPSEYVQTYSGDCVTPQNIFYRGDTVCVEAGGFPGVLEYLHRRFQWASPNGQVASHMDVTGDPQYEKFEIPTSGEFSQLGTWSVQSVNVDADIYGAARFIVRERERLFTNLSIAKYGPEKVLPGEQVMYKLWIHTPGPNDAEGVEIIEQVPSNMYFVALKQADDTPIECRTPLRGETGQIVCNLKGLPTDSTVGLIAYYRVASEVREGTICTGETQVTSGTEELDKHDNYSTFKATVASPDGEDPGPAPEEP